MIKELTIYIQELGVPVVLAIIIFKVTMLTDYCIQNRAEAFNMQEFKRRYFRLYGGACIYSFCFLNLQYISHSLGNGSIIENTIFIFFLFAIIKIQKEENIRNLEEDWSGIIMYTTSVMCSKILLGILLEILLWSYIIWKIFKNDKKEELKTMKYGLECVDTIVVIFISQIIVPKTFVQNWQLNLMMISIFTLVLPQINSIVTRLFEKS